ncbi:hypothetical protein AG1IA_00310 [Rhizoctonia solani AG-1 IA]|uniref:Uncharacterized protein n=1 Tax=Thanatephorus cucumeris (strain AG1-IA) TaxID=983506 RepID=L8X5T5_THACA|nr:hypothetical protein AG1IA_00310 [Rhizoctonia solani AG-1 IA]
MSTLAHDHVHLLCLVPTYRSTRLVECIYVIFCLQYDECRVYDRFLAPLSRNSSCLAVERYPLELLTARPIPYSPPTPSRPEHSLEEMAKRERPNAEIIVAADGGQVQQCIDIRIEGMLL